MFKFSILITTKNRLEELKVTLEKNAHLFRNKDIECLICDDGSFDGTLEYLEQNYPNVKVLRNQKSKGLIYSRNRLLALTRAKYAIILDDDAHVVSDNSLEEIEFFFENNLSCGVIAFRIFWGKILPVNLDTSEIKNEVRGFVGCGHVWRIEAWKTIPDYPEWFEFYGEEDFAGFYLLKNQWQVWYLPSVLIQHRVDIRERKFNGDYVWRLRRSLRSGWFLYIIFYPIDKCLKLIIYTFWMQIKLKVLKGDIKALKAILLALIDLILLMPKLLKNRNVLSVSELKKYHETKETRIYWNPEYKSL